MRSEALPKQFNSKYLIKGVLFGFLVVALMVLTVGCSKKKSSNSNNFNNCQVGQYCVNPGAGNGFGVQPGYGNGVVGLGYDQNSGSEVFLEFVGPTNQSPYYMTGQVYVYGQLRTNGIQCNDGSFLPGGTYALESQQAVYAQNGVVNGANLSMNTQFGQMTVQVSYATMLYPINGVQTSQYLPLSASLSLNSQSGWACSYMNVQGN